MNRETRQVLVGLFGEYIEDTPRVRIDMCEEGPEYAMSGQVDEDGREMIMLPLVEAANKRPYRRAYQLWLWSDGKTVKGRVLKAGVLSKDRVRMMRFDPPELVQEAEVA